MPSSGKGWSTRLESFLSSATAGPRRKGWSTSELLFSFSILGSTRVFCFGVVLKIEITPRGSQKYTQQSNPNRANKDSDGDKEDESKKEEPAERLGQEGEGAATAPGCIRPAG